MSSLIFIASSEVGEREKEREDMVIGGLGKVDFCKTFTVDFQSCLV